jgi:DNA processing protein
LINLLSFTPTAVDDLIAKSSLTAPQVLTILLEMEIAGMVTRHSGNRVSRKETDKVKT